MSDWQVGDLAVALHDLLPSSVTPPIRELQVLIVHHLQTHPDGTLYLGFYKGIPVGYKNILFRKIFDHERSVFLDLLKVNFDTFKGDLE